MDSAQLEAILNEDESTSLDFKRDQYSFDGATDDQKSELLKDILAFANAWRRTDAYILIGVEEVRGGRSYPLGVSGHLDDAKLQQFVNAKTNRKIDFRYEVMQTDGITVGVIHVPLQERPSFLNKDYGKLRENVVYIRRGSSTDIARPDEIAKMGARAAVQSPPKLALAYRVESNRSIFLSIRNEPGSGPARAPRLLINPRGPWVEDNWGLDGNGRFGLPRIAKGRDIAGFLYGGESTILAGVTHDVTHLEYRGSPEAMVGSLDIDYELSAEGAETNLATLTVKF